MGRGIIDISKVSLEGIIEGVTSSIEKLVCKKKEDGLTKPDEVNLFYLRDKLAGLEEILKCKRKSIDKFIEESMRDSGRLN